MSHGENDDSLLVCNASAELPLTSYGERRTAALFASLGVFPLRIAKKGGNPVATLFFGNSDDAHRAASLLSAQTNSSGQPLFVVSTNGSISTPLPLKRARSPSSHAQTQICDNNAEADNAACPWNHWAYSDQLQHKQELMLQVMRETGLFQGNLEPIVASPVIQGYRNRCHFSCGLSLKGEPAVGFFKGRQHARSVIEEDMTEHVHIPAVAHHVCVLFAGFLKTSAWPVYDKTARSGVWRRVQVRNCEILRELMVTITIDPTPVTSSAELSTLRTSLISLFANAFPTAEEEHHAKFTMISPQIRADISVCA